MAPTFKTWQKRRELLQLAEKSFGITPSVIKHHQAFALAQLIQRNLPNPTSKSNIVLATGDNEKLPIVLEAATLLQSDHCQPTIVLLKNRDEHSLLNREVFKSYQNYHLQYFCLEEIDLNQLLKTIFNAVIIIDALFTPEFSGKIIEPATELIDFINQARGLKIALDNPTGVSLDSESIADQTIKANFTLSGPLAHENFKNPNISALSGKLIISNLGLPSAIFKEAGINYESKPL
ncbi:MAG: NAD(P)H-hydrate epimerase [bacterium]